MKTRDTQKRVSLQLKMYQNYLEQMRNKKARIHKAAKGIRKAAGK